MLCIIMHTEAYVHVHTEGNVHVHTEGNVHVHTETCNGLLFLCCALLLSSIPLLLSFPFSVSSCIAWGNTYYVGLVLLEPFLFEIKFN